MACLSPVGLVNVRPLSSFAYNLVSASCLKA